MLKCVRMTLLAVSMGAANCGFASAQGQGATASAQGQGATEQQNSTLPKQIGTAEASAKFKVDLKKDIAFTKVGDTELLCDLYLPVSLEQGQPESSDKQAGTLRPAVLVIHGGGWAIGDKWSVGMYAQALAEQGIVAVSMNYRHAPKYKFPAQIDDCRSALLWIVENAEKLNIDQKKIGLFGYSAGAHLSCMIGTLSDADWKVVQHTTDWAENDPRWKRMPSVCTVVGGGAPCDFRDLPLDNTAIAYFLGGSRRQQPTVYNAASPAAHASAGDPPILFIHGTEDLIVPIASSRVLFDAHRRAGVPSQFLALEGLGHMMTFINPRTKSEAVKFLSEHLLGK